MMNVLANSLCFSQHDQFSVADQFVSCLAFTHGHFYFFVLCCFYPLIQLVQAQMFVCFFFVFFPKTCLLAELIWPLVYISETFFRFKKIIVNNFGDLVMFKSFITVEYQIFAGSIFSNVWNGCSPLVSFSIQYFFILDCWLSKMSNLTMSL